MPQSLAQIYVHLVFSCKDRIPYLKTFSLREELYRYLAGGCKNLGSPALCVGGVEDHTHLLCRLGRSATIADFVRELKKESSAWIKKKENALADFHWQAGYGAFSVSPGHVEEVIRYIANQVEHHRKESYQDEFRRLLTKYGLQWDERYVWD